jgi:hypothetical protein
VKNLRRKIEDDPGNPRIIQTVLGGGYRLGLARDVTAGQDVVCVLAASRGLGERRPAQVQRAPPVAL